MPQTAENVAKRFNISREEQDAFAFESQQRAKKALATKRFAEEIVPVYVKDRKGHEIIVETDEHPRPDTTLEALAKLRPIFENGTVTAGNASGVNDGASALLLMSAKKAKELGITPLARYITGAVTGLEPAVMGLGPIYSSKKALQRAGLTTKDIGLYEINEAFAAQAIESIKQLGLNPAQVNVNGGAIAFGHPLGASGARIVTTLLYEMKKQNVQYGLASMCIGVGQGIATIIENIE